MTRPTVYAICPKCNGTGVEHSPNYEPCGSCEGYGHVLAPERTVQEGPTHYVDEATGRSHPITTITNDSYPAPERSEDWEKDDRSFALGYHQGATETRESPASPVQEPCTGCSHCDTAITVEDVDRIKADMEIPNPAFIDHAYNAGLIEGLNRIKSLIQSHTDTEGK